CQHLYHDLPHRRPYQACWLRQEECPVCCLSLDRPRQVWPSIRCTWPAPPAQILRLVGMKCLLHHFHRYQRGYRCPLPHPNQFSTCPVKSQCLRFHCSHRQRGRGFGVAAASVSFVRGPYSDVLCPELAALVPTERAAAVSLQFRPMPIV